MRIVIRSWAWLLLTMLPAAVFAQLPEKSTGTFMAIGGNLTVDSPVNINGPYPEAVREVAVDGVMQLQIRYPIAPPMPQLVTVTSVAKHVEFITSVRTASEVAVLSQQPKTNGKIGIGYVQVLVRGASAGKELVTVRLKRQDGSVRDVPYAFEVK